MSDEQTRTWTIRELMKSAIEHLQKQGMEEARLNVELLLAHALDLQRIQLYLNFDKPLTSDEVKRFRSLYERRLKREPVQYIIGSASFMGLHFAVDSRVLIPRPETETLIEQIIIFCHRYPADVPIHLLEIGTGSGNIAISIAKFIKNAYVNAIDNSFEALAVAKQNACMHSIESRIKFSCEDVFNDDEELFRTRYELIISNPPYIARDEWDNLQAEIRNYEPLSAVTDGNDGFKFYHRISEVIPKILTPGGGVVLEVGFGQAEVVAGILSKAGLEQLQITNDLQGVQRVISGIWAGSQETMIGLN